MDTIAPGLGSDIDHWMVDASCGGIEDVFLVRDSDGHGVNQDVAVIGRVEVALAADGRDADAVAVSSDASNAAGDKMARLWIIGCAKAERVHVGHWPRAHGENVAQDAADAGCRALIGLNEGGVVVALHLEDRRLAVANIDYPGILARTTNHPGRLGR